jgi:hypothetical protein
MLYLTIFGWCIVLSLCITSAVLLYQRFVHQHKELGSVFFLSNKNCYTPESLDFKKSSKQIIVLVYKQNLCVDVMPFDTLEAAYYWGLMIVQNSREVWGIPKTKTNKELLLNWTNYTAGTEHIAIFKKHVTTLQKTRTKQSN